MTLPRSTVRLQLGPSFTINDARAQIPYFAALGISHFYVSPISTARPGSTHGYDVINHALVNPELGGESALIALVDALRAHHMGLIIDIVPNHMAAHPGNAWWWDVLKHGEASKYATWLDIDWRPPDPALNGKVLAPFLAKHYGAALASGDIQLVFDDVAGSFEIDVLGVRYPLAPGTLHADRADVRGTLRRYAATRESGRRRLHELLERQHYRLAWWRYAADGINWRRFFEISELIGVRVELPQVFEAVHALTLRLYAQGMIDGVRVDHVDGLAQPVSYCRTLVDALKARTSRRPPGLRSDEAWVVVEKILAHGETLDEAWPVHGTSGYDFMDQASAVLHDPEGERVLTAHWRTTAQDERTPQMVRREARRLMLQRHFVAERSALLRTLATLAQSSPDTRDWSIDAIARVLDELLVEFPVYRTYADPGRDHNSDAAQSQSVAALHSEAIRRFQQLTPPLAAKSLEDTVFYRFGRLLSRNEVGSDPAVFAITTREFHDRNRWRVAHAPHSMLATATHDHKRGEDVRARLAVLSEIPERWAAASRRWLGRSNTRKPRGNSGRNAERYMFFQTLVGAWPLDLTLDDRPGLERYAKRLVQWQIKALREAKINSNWFEPDIAYENESADFIEQLLLDPGKKDLLNEIWEFVGKIAPAGAVNSLAQTLMRITSPGVPDLYQGTEFWDFSLVDPDNRANVHYAALHAGLAGVDAGMPVSTLVGHWRDGRIKQAVVTRGLHVLRDRAEVFAGGKYLPIPVTGAAGGHVLAFMRASRRGSAVVVVPRLSFHGVLCAAPCITARFWGNTEVVLPRYWADAALHDAMEGVARRCGSGAAIRVADLFARMPIALLLPD